MRNKSGQRSQTTRRLIRKIQNESNKSRQSQQDISTSLHVLQSVKKNLFNQSEHGIRENCQVSEENESDEPDQSDDADKAKNKWFEYSTIRATPPPVREETNTNEDDEEWDSVNRDDLPNNCIQDNRKFHKHTSSGNINPMIESVMDTPQQRIKARAFSKADFSSLEQFHKEIPNKKLDYSVHDFTNSYDATSRPKVSNQMQAKLIENLNGEISQLVNTLTKLDSECTTVKCQLHASQAENSKSKLIGKADGLYLANEQLNLSNNLKVQKEARERELKAAKDTITTLQQTIGSKDKEIYQLQFCKKFCLTTSIERISVKVRANWWPQNTSGHTQTKLR